MTRRIFRKRILRGLTLAFAIAIAIPVTNAAARPLSDDPVVYGASVQQSQAQSSAPIVSEKVAGLQLPVSNGNPYHLRKFHVYSPVAEKIAEIGLPSQSAGGSTANSSPIVSEKTAGLGLPSQPDTVVSTPSSGFDWSDAGIGAGATTALLVAMLGGALLFVRRRHGHHGTFAH